MTGIYTRNGGRRVDTHDDEQTPRPRPTLKPDYGIEHHRPAPWYRAAPSRPLAIAAALGAVGGLAIGLFRHFF